VYYDSIEFFNLDSGSIDEQASSNWPTEPEPALSFFEVLLVDFTRCDGA
jgi:hypothetical protein